MNLGSASRSYFEMSALSGWRSCRDTYLSNVDESTHEVLVAESVDGLLSLLPRGIFYNAVVLLASSVMERSP